MKHHQINWKEINRRANELMERFNVHIDVTRPLSYYSTAIQQMVSIARAVDIDAKVLILDEPTSSLDETRSSSSSRTCALEGAGHWHHLHHTLPRSGL